MLVSTANAGYQAPSVTVASSLPKRAGDAVLVVPVISGQDEDATATVVGNPFLDAEAVGEIDVALKALGAKGGTDQLTRVVAPVAHRWPVSLLSGSARDRDEWPADVIRRAAGVAARSLNGTAAVITTLSDPRPERGDRGLILGAYRFTDFRSSKTAPKDDGLRTITVLATDTKAKTKAAAEARGGDRDRSDHCARSGQHPTQSPVIRPNSPSAQTLWVRRRASRSRCSMTRRWPRTATAA